MPRVLLVCTANLCRSPMAAALLRRRLAQDEKRRTWHVDSAGTWAEEGLPASRYAIEELAERGLDLSTHRSQSVSDALLESADLVLTMTAHHAEALRHAFPDYARRVYLLTEIVGRRYDIGDPYGGPRSGYTRTTDELERLIEAGYARIVALVEGMADARGAFSPDTEPQSR